MKAKVEKVRDVRDIQLEASRRREKKLQLRLIQLVALIEEEATWLEDIKEYNRSALMNRAGYLRKESAI